MSYRELRNFGVYLRTLSYPEYISPESFRSHNFALVAKLLKWLIERLDPNADIPLDIDTCEERIEFLQAAAQTAWNTGEIRLNLRHLYKADGYAVKELIKIAHVLYKSIQFTNEPLPEVDFSPGDDLEVLRSSKNLGTKLVENGAEIYNLFGNEHKHAESRNKALEFLDELAFNLETNEPQKKLEQNILKQTEDVKRETDRLKLQIQRCEADEGGLQKKITRKSAEFERCRKQLQNLKQMDKPFMIERANLEEELKQLHEIYVETYRNLSWLDTEVANYREKELSKKAEADRQLKRMQKRIREDKRRLLHGEHPEDLDNLLHNEVDEDSSSASEYPRKGSKGGREIMPRRPTSRRGRFRLDESESLSERDIDKTDDASEETTTDMIQSEDYMPKENERIHLEGSEHAHDLVESSEFDSEDSNF